MKTLSVLILGAALAAPQAYSAGEQTPPPPYALKNRSSFTAKGDRSPFWPVGWKGQTLKVVNPTIQKEFKIEPHHFTVTSVLLTPPPLATINGRSFGEGETLPVSFEGQRVKVVVKAIRDGGVWLEQSGHQIFVPIKREEIPTKTSDGGQTPAVEFVIPLGGDKGQKKPR